MKDLSTIWNSLTENEKTQFGVSMDDRYLVINAPITPEFSFWNREFENLSELKQTKIKKHLAEYNWRFYFGKQNPLIESSQFR